ncbi:8746_t:CDS:2 [Diversispora eburnea]|uniref:8746_t:CDS:1 n=1 Tax=Diversispora eburnea TaxID=1213867 RepID=A0A9N9CAP5_9GLOM|nr:8746_t:CDS:2 [Diversispora eburnea]
MSFSTSDENFLELTTPLTSEVPACFKGLEKPWAELIKDGRDFRKEPWFETHIKLAKKENITPLEHFAKFVRRTEEVLQEDEKELDCGDAPSSPNNSDSRRSRQY